jgi:hypothetical protein
VLPAEPCLVPAAGAVGEVQRLGQVPARRWETACLLAVVNTAGVTCYLLGGLLLTAVPARARIAAAGLFGLVTTGAFAWPLLAAAEYGRAGDPQPLGGPLSAARVAKRRCAQVEVRHNEPSG